MAYAAILLAGLALLWVGWTPGAFEPDGLIALCIGVSLAFVMALAMRIADREGAPYLRAPAIAALRARRASRILAAALDVARRAVAGDARLHPALVRFKTRPGGGIGRIAFANALAATPGAIVVEADDDSLLIHVLIEDDADAEELRALEAQAARGRA